jgi:hypothetical protein
MHKLSYGFLCKTQNVANCAKTFANPIDKYRKMMYNDVTTKGTDVRFPKAKGGEAMHRLKMVNGIYYADGNAFKTFREALESIWHKR